MLVSLLVQGASLNAAARWLGVALRQATQAPVRVEIDRIGVNLTEEFHLVPEQSTSAIVVPHPEAKYFVV